MANPDTLARRLFSEVFSTGDPAALDRWCADDFVGEDSYEGKLDRDDLREALAAFHRAFPDLAYELEDVIAQGDKAVVRWIMRGTNRGPLRDTGKTCQPIEVDGISICEFEGGKLSGMWTSWNTLRFFEQLELLVHVPPARQHPEHHGGASTRSSVHHRG